MNNLFTGPSVSAELPLLEFRHVSKEFAGKQLINNVSFTLMRNHLTTLIGPNGAGKTTIARLMLGLDRPSSGEVIVSARIKMGYVPQKFNHGLELPITAGNFLNLLAPDNAKSNYKEILDLINLDQLDQDISKLSGGQLQKLVLAAALLRDPDLIVLDEPTQSLDVTSQQEFYRIINHLKQKSNITIFMISHDLFVVMKNSDQVICLNGHICCSGLPQDFTNNKDFADVLSSIGFYTHHHDHKH